MAYQQPMAPTSGEHCPWGSVPVMLADLRILSNRAGDAHREWKAAIAASYPDLPALDAMVAWANDTLADRLDPERSEVLHALWHRREAAFAAVVEFRRESAHRIITDALREPGDLDSYRNALREAARLLAEGGAG